MTTLSLREQFAARMRRPAEQVTVAPQVIDPLSAALARALGFEAVYLGGGGLGYSRAVTEALLTASEVADATRQITERVDIAVIVDGGIGFGDAVHMGRAIKMIEQTGACAVEIEDQVAPKRVHHHKGVEHLVTTEEMVGKIKAAADARRDEAFLLIARCNAIRHEGLEQALIRANAYVEAGADLLMLMPRGDDEMRTIASSTVAPLVWMGIGASPPFPVMQDAGYPLIVDPMSATVLMYRALKEGWTRMREGTDFGMSREEVRAVISEVGTTMGIEALYDIEARTTERPE